MLYAINVGEDEIGRMDADRFAAAERPNTETVVVCGKLEAEMAQLGEDEIGTFLEDYGLTESGMIRLIRSTYHLLGLISFLTAGEEECRAWTIRNGTRAQLAAGAIHSDLEKHFIRAEVAAFSDFKEHGGFPALRDKGLLRLEGKDYVVADGDILTTRHSG
jgi:ribosome-binding ATPase YchF (GTP1/OBG family)